MTTDASPLPLRRNGVYRFRDREYTVIPLSTAGKPWQSTGLIHWPPETDSPLDIIYLRHADLVVLSFIDFRPIGTATDLIDTGRDDARE